MPPQPPETRSKEEEVAYNSVSSSSFLSFFSTYPLLSLKAKRSEVANRAVSKWLLAVCYCCGRFSRAPLREARRTFLWSRFFRGERWTLHCQVVRTHSISQVTFSLAPVIRRRPSSTCCTTQAWCHLILDGLRRRRTQFLGPAMSSSQTYYTQYREEPIIGERRAASSEHPHTLHSGHDVATRG